MLKTSSFSPAPYRSFAEVLGDTSIQAIAIATPAETHANLVREALLAGKDVCVEKPLCLSVETGESLIALAKELNRILMVGHLLVSPGCTQTQRIDRQWGVGPYSVYLFEPVDLGKIRREENILWSFA